MDSELLRQRAKAFDYLFDAVVIVDLNGTITDWNKGSEDLYGYTKDEVLGRPVSILHVPEDVESVTQEVMSAVEKSGKWTGEIKMVHKDGHIGWIESMCVPFYDANKNMIGSLGINRDISRRIAAKHALKLEKAKLRDEVHVKNRFFSIIAHDLNSPYNQLLGFTNILSNKANSLSKEETAELAKKVNDAALQVFNLQKDLLEWSRSQFITGRAISKSVSLHELAQEAIQTFKGIAKNKNISVTNQISKTDIFVDPDMMLTVFRNLISNALKFSHPGEEVTLSSEEKEDVMKVTVSDNGVGIPSELIETLFSLDNMVSRVGTDGETGTGIGMTLCKEMIEKSGGRIWLESTVDKGTQVYFNLPME